MRPSTSPTIVPLAVLAGMVFALAISYVGAPSFGIAATILGVGAGGALAAVFARKHGLFQGMAVGIALVVFGALGLFWQSAPGDQTIVADTGRTIVLDAIHLAAACAGGYLVRRD